MRSFYSLITETSFLICKDQRMKNMRRAIVLSILLLLFLTTPQGDNKITLEITENFTPSQGLIPIERDWTANIVVVGYDVDVINETILLQGMPTSRVYPTDSVQITYNIGYNVVHADSSYISDLR